MISPSIKETLDWLVEGQSFETARVVAESVYRHLPQGNIAADNFLAEYLFRSRSFHKVRDLALSILERVPGDPGAVANAARCCVQVGEADYAEKLFYEHKISEMDPAYVDLGLVLSHLGRYDESRAILERIESQFEPNCDERPAHVTRFNLAWHYMYMGRFKESLEMICRHGRALKIWGSQHDLPEVERLQPGMNVNGKRILILDEAGIGDSVIMARFAKTIAERGGTAIWAGRKDVLDLFKRTPGISQIIDLNEPGSVVYDHWAPALDLPVLLDIDLKDLPRENYIFPESSYVEKWARKLRSQKRFKVGIRWQGNPKYELDLMRTVPLEELSRLFEIKGIDFYSLQRDDGYENLPRSGIVTDWGRDLQTWDDTAGAIANLDLVISSCTSVVHVAAAMGKPTWVLCPVLHYFTWAIPGKESVWYPSCRLYKQPRVGNWKPCLDEIYDDLKRLV